ncbi:MAG: hypothetical protein RML33_08300 [Acidobacteriota bacterium]|nr:hypothetical protein [Pyrinomonadaceae bacterium]MDW8304821.1 hypothetical protein [Acidobacteriota bacterium]
MNLIETNNLISCPRCHRLSPPTRHNCLYCGTEIIISNNSSKKHRKPEPWEKGYNLVILNYFQENYFSQKPHQSIDIDPEDLQSLINQKAKAPISRVLSRQEAEELARALEAIGLICDIVPDVALEKMPKRLRRIDFQEEKTILTLFSGKVLEIDRNNLTLVVEGKVFRKRIHAVEERRKKRNQLKESSEFDEDELLADIYIDEHSTGYRILPTGFDFSSLGSEKRNLAVENFPILIEKLIKSSPKVHFINNYPKIRKTLDKIWPVEEKHNRIRWRRKSFGSYEFENEILFSNLEQFNKYSNLQWYLTKR